jgi:hypothetical protein
MAQAAKLVQLRVPPELYDQLVKAVAERQRQGQRASLNSVAVEWLEQASGAADEREVIGGPLEARASETTPEAAHG